MIDVGGGPAGCKAAITAHDRGHQVILIEQRDKLGGQLNLAQHEMHKQELKAYRDYLENQINKRDIQVMYKTTATKNLLEQLNGDVVLVAIGASPIRLHFPGEQLEYVDYFENVYPKLDSLKDNVCIVGGGQVGIELAVELLERGKLVTVIEMTDQIASQGHILYRAGLRRLLKRFEKQLTILINSQCLGFSESGVKIINKNGESIIKCDNAIIAVGMKPNREEAFKLYGIADETMMFGDCEKLGQVVGATNDAYFIAANI